MLAMGGIITYAPPNSIGGRMLFVTGMMDFMYYMITEIFGNGLFEYFYYMIFLTFIVVAVRKLLCW